MNATHRPGALLPVLLTAGLLLAGTFLAWAGLPDRSPLKGPRKPAERLIPAPGLAAAPIEAPRDRPGQPPRVADHQPGEPTMGETPPVSGVLMNGRPLRQEQFQQLQQLYGAAPTSGAFWYDAVSGLYGLWGREALGFILPGHDFGPLPADASNGTTGVFINGRNLPLVEVLFLQQLFGVVYPGRWWLDGRTGNIGMEGNPFPIANLVLALRQAQQGQAGGGGGGGYRWRNNTGSGGVEGGCVWINVPGAGSAMSGGC